MLNWINRGSHVYCNERLQFTCHGTDLWQATTKAEHFVRILAALEAMHTLTRNATNNREEHVPEDQLPSDLYQQAWGAGYEAALESEGVQR
jgi:hypothetical protein